MRIVLRVWSHFELFEQDGEWFVVVDGWPVRAGTVAVLISVVESA